MSSREDVSSGDTSRDAASHGHASRNDVSRNDASQGGASQGGASGGEAWRGPARGASTSRPPLRQAAELLEDWVSETRLDRRLVDRAFAGVPLDFTVHFASTLPLGAHGAGAAGITLFGRVHLVLAVLSWPPLERILILRHEAEHVRQQRSDFFFYLRYAAGWTRAAARGLVDRGAADRSMRALARRAYLAIPAEVEAYQAERAARRILTGRHTGGPEAGGS